MVASSDSINRENQGKVLPAIPPFSAPAEGQLSNVLSFGSVQRTATGPSNDSDIETLFATKFSLSKGNTALPGGTFFKETRDTVVTTNGSAPAYAVGTSGAVGNNDGGPDLDGVVFNWLYYARGFSFGGFTGTTSGSTPIVGDPREVVLDPVGNTLDDLYVHPMDIPTVPYAGYYDVVGYSPTVEADQLRATRTNNKILLQTGTGSTGYASFRSANTDMFFSMLHMPPATPNRNNISLAVQNISTLMTGSPQSGSSNYGFGNVPGGGLNRNQLRQLNLGQNGTGVEETVLNGSTDICFMFNYSNSIIGSGSSQRNNPIGNILKCEFPVPVRGFCVLHGDANASSTTNTTSAGSRGTRLLIEGDFTDGTTFSYFMFSRGGGIGNAQASRSSIGTASYLALNSRKDKHIKRLYFSNISYNPYQIGHYDHGPIDALGPAKYYENNQTGNSGEFPILSGFPGRTSLTGDHQDQDDTFIKLNVMPAYDQNYFQLEKRPGGGDRVYGQVDETSGGGEHNRAQWNEWRKISQNQSGKTFGRTGSFENVFGSRTILGHGVTFVSGAVTGSTLGITMGFVSQGDRQGPADDEGDVPLGVEGTVEAFHYEVIKGTTVGGTFIPVWKKTRTV
jgi:hypothetical protein